VLPTSNNQLRPDILTAGFIAASFEGACGQGYEGGVAAICSNGAWTFVGLCTGGLAGLTVVQLLHLQD
jgi:hypothetical protein